MQGDLFKSDPQPSLFSEEAGTVVVRADPDAVRVKLRKVIELARASSAMPWDARQLRYWRTVVPQMSLWLPEDEAAQMRLAFQTEVERLGG
jgi:hypothetical protein